MTAEDARSALAEAHKTMTPGEIAAHALVLASEVAVCRRLVEKGVSTANTLARSLEAGQAALSASYGVIREINRLFVSGKKREARESLWRAAKIEYRPEVMTLADAPQWPTDTFNPGLER